jgi:hypothetical protein
MTLSFGGLALLGFVVAIVGTAGHRYQPYWGSILVLAVAASGGVFARAWRSWIGLAVYAGVWVSTVQYLYYGRGRGGSVAILWDALGWTWMYGGAVAVVLAATLPRRFLAEERPANG